MLVLILKAIPANIGFDTPATTNGCEKYYKHLKDLIGSAHSNVCKFGLVLIERQELTYVKLQGLAAERTRKVDVSIKRREIRGHCVSFSRENLQHTS